MRPRAEEFRIRSARSRIARRSFESRVPSAQATATSGTRASAATVSARIPIDIKLSRTSGLAMPEAWARASRVVFAACRSLSRSISRLSSRRKNSSSRLFSRSCRISGDLMASSLQASPAFKILPGIRRAHWTFVHRMDVTKSLPQS
jgi:hypothetical protein